MPGPGLPRPEEMTPSGMRRSAGHSNFVFHTCCGGIPGLALCLQGEGTKGDALRLSLDSDSDQCRSLFHFGLWFPVTHHRNGLAIRVNSSLVPSLVSLASPALPWPQNGRVGWVLEKSCSQTLRRVMTPHPGALKWALSRIPSGREHGAEK